MRQVVGGGPTGCVAGQVLCFVSGFAGVDGHVVDRALETAYVDRGEIPRNTVRGLYQCGVQLGGIGDAIESEGDVIAQCDSVGLQGRAVGAGQDVQLCVGAQGNGIGKNLQTGWAVDGQCAACAGHGQIPVERCAGAG